MIPDLIYDVGMHLGKDTEFYLQKGFRVVAIEANPHLVERVKHRLSDELRSGQLTILELAVSDHSGIAKLWVNAQNDLCSSLRPEPSHRSAGAKPIDVKSERMEAILRKHGIPYYLKVDIEGADLFCIKALREFPSKPKYVSFECALGDFAMTFEALAELWTLGYRSFKFVNQTRHSEVRCPNPPLEGKHVDAAFDVSMSGPFGEESPGSWLTIKQTMEKLFRLQRQQAWRQTYERTGRVLGIPLRRFHRGIKWFYNFAPVRMMRKSCSMLRRREVGGWFDIHARLEK